MLNAVAVWSFKQAKCAVEARFFKQAKNVVMTRLLVLASVVILIVEAMSSLPGTKSAVAELSLSLSIAVAKIFRWKYRHKLVAMIAPRSPHTIRQPNVVRKAG